MCQFQRIVEQFFKDYGRLVAKWPLLFIILSSLLAFTLTAAFVWNARDATSRVGDDQLRSFLPENAQSIRNLHRLRSIFPISVRDVYDAFQSSYAYFILISNNNDHNVLREDAFVVAGKIIEKIKSIKIKMGWMDVSWGNLCVKMNEICLEHPILTFLNGSITGSLIERFAMLRPFLTYPESRIGDQLIDNSLIFGNVTTTNNGTILEASAIRFPFLLQAGDSPERKMLNEMWQREFVKTVRMIKIKNLSIHVSSSISWKDEMDRNGTMLLIYLPALFAVLVVFSIICCCTLDCITSQPWLGFCGVLSAVLAVLSAFGVLFFFQYQYLQVVIIMPFLVLSISADNAFLMLNAWRNTSHRGNLEERMSDTMSQSAVSILITALTDGLSFTVGSASQFPAVRIFCTYCAIAILFAFIYQTTFFAACLTLCGRREMAKRHCLTLRKSTIIDFKHHCHIENSTPPIPSINLSSLMATCLDNNIVKFMVVILYSTYLSFSVYGVTNSELRLNMSNLVPYDSYVIGERQISDEYFSHFNGHAQAVIFTENIQFNNISTIGRLIELYDRLCSTQYSSKGNFWLPEFMETYTMSRRNITLSKLGMIQAIKTFLNEHITYRDDIIWSDDAYHIKATRMFVRLKHIKEKNQSAAAHILRQRFDESAFSGFIIDPIIFLLADQNDAVLGCILQDAAIATAIIVIIILVFLPKFLCAVWIGLSILSINIGVIGFLALWHVQVDTISMMTTVMSVGLSVDYVAHVTYHYLITKDTSSYTRLYNAFEHAGWSSIQSAVATALGASTLAFVDSYMVQTFVKTVILVVSLGLLHGLIFLPVALSAFIPADQYLETNNYAPLRNYIAATVRQTTVKPRRRLTSYFVRRYLPSLEDQSEIAKVTTSKDQLKRKVRKNAKNVKPEIQNWTSENSITCNDCEIGIIDQESLEIDSRPESSIVWTSASSNCLLASEINIGCDKSNCDDCSPFYDTPPPSVDEPEMVKELSPLKLNDVVKIVVYKDRSNGNDQRNDRNGHLMRTFGSSTGENVKGNK